MAGIHSFTVDAGADYQFTAEAVEDDETTAIDITGYSARMQVRSQPLSAGDPLLDLSTPSAGMTIPVGTDGRILVHLTNAQTASLRKGTYAYDLEIVDTGNIVTRLLQGIITVNPNTTR